MHRWRTVVRPPLPRAAARRRWRSHMAPASYSGRGSGSDARYTTEQSSTTCLELSDTAPDIGRLANAVLASTSAIKTPRHLAPPARSVVDGGPIWSRDGRTGGANAREGHKPPPSRCSIDSTTSPPPSSPSSLHYAALLLLFLPFAVFAAPAVRGEATWGGLRHGRRGSDRLGKEHVRPEHQSPQGFRDRSRGGGRCMPGMRVEISPREPFRS